MGCTAPDGMTAARQASGGVDGQQPATLVEAVAKGWSEAESTPQRERQMETLLAFADSQFWNNATEMTPEEFEGFFAEMWSIYRTGALPSTPDGRILYRDITLFDSPLEFGSYHVVECLRSYLGFESPPLTAQQFSNADIEMHSNLSDSSIAIYRLAKESAAFDELASMVTDSPQEQLEYRPYMEFSGRWSINEAPETPGWVKTYSFDKTLISPAIRRLGRYLNAVRALLRHSLTQGEIEDATLDELADYAFLAAHVEPYPAGGSAGLFFAPLIQAIDKLYSEDPNALEYAWALDILMMGAHDAATARDLFRAWKTGGIRKAFTDRTSPCFRYRDAVLRYEKPRMPRRNRCVDNGGR